MPLSVPRRSRRAGPLASRHERDERNPRWYTVVLKPQLADAEGHPEHGSPLRETRVEATGELGASGYPRYAGSGVQADIDPATGAVEAVTVDGDELPLGYVAQAREGDVAGGDSMVPGEYEFEAPSAPEEGRARVLTPRSA
ncbi:hypothetical protein OIM90_00585 [Streptomyces sp. AD16]|nr:hypothetical protein OIM90_00585 [Streptomyces sp. AD16]